ncbi:bifunctional metallophosphatase/5'-nucleotidase [Bacillus solitudinis]|uniref:bifunctional metallophosphatase/5'-nucleotidase n=1 Tax=Bacillus solitudinis TaxID=2014074 RepID=UPI000C234AFB|nr:bifunctional UDP-sugar hydrolase/5'-nucleotidase [Bacillus solitudinis]
MKTERIRIFHTNDVHSCFDYWPKIVGYVNKHRDEQTLFFDIGDHADRSHPITEATEGKGNVSLLNEAGVDFATIGNNEGITFSKEQLCSLYEQATFQVLVANLFHQDGTRPKWAAPYHVHQMESGLKIAIIGLTAPFTRFYQQLGWTIEPPIELLREIMEEINGKSDVVILLSHLGLARDEEIAETIEGIDLILGAHTHDVLHQGKHIRETMIAQAGKLGAYLGEITFDYDHQQKSIIWESVQLIDFQTDTSPENPKTSALIKTLQDVAEKTLAEPVAVIPKTFPVSWEEETEAARLLCDAVTEWCGEEIGMMNSGVLLESIRAGILTRGDIHRMCPHPINPCVVKLTGKDLYQTIKRSLTNEMKTLQLRGFGFRGKVLGHMLYSGITIADRDDALDILILGEKLEEDREYKIATLDMYTFGHLYPCVSDSSYKAYFMPEFLRDILSWKLKQKWS